MIETKVIITEEDSMSEFTNQATAIVLDFSIDGGSIEAAHPHPALSEELTDVTVVHTKSGCSFMLNIDYKELMSLIEVPSFFAN